MMYGLTPMAKIVKRPRAPPVNMFRKPKMLPPPMSRLSAKPDRVDAGDRNEGADAKDDEQRRRIEHLPTKVADAQRVPERVQQLDHLGLSTGGLDLLRSPTWRSRGP